MKLAVNYSRPLAALVRSGRITVDRYKCPAWDGLVAEANAAHPTYVHFPLRVGLGGGTTLDTEANVPIQWETRVEALRAQTDTPFVNLHVKATAADYPSIPAETTDPAHADWLLERFIDDVTSVTARYGAENVMVENGNIDGGDNLRPGYLPETLTRIVESTGCGLLLDISHAVIAADHIGMDIHDYLAALPVAHLREIHVTGVHQIDEAWQEKMRRLGVNEATIGRFAGRLQDHLPMTDPDWELLDWVLGHIQCGAWGTPWAISFEYGGIGGMWEALVDAEVLESQVPRLYAMVHGG